MFARVHQRITSASDPRRLVSWIYQVTRNAIIDHYRKPGRQREILSGLSAEIEVLNEVSATSTAIYHDDAAEPRAELAACLRPMIERLSRDYRGAITLVKLEGLTQQSAEKQMGLSLSGMKSKVQRGRARLKQMLNDCCLIELDRRKGVIDYQSRRADCNLCGSDQNTPETDF